ncbi:hypothetical protein ANANG_G00143660 [Anguilla anguilla]|uniref:Uncharacterized protein n=1 Tax=Anguilla anguilla TaxID=7936 RepID=A0A9D3MEM0_ANGAN|nr:hypothetical protein ANANG_G00143660 [Anguilla anguilla]
MELAAQQMCANVMEYCQTLLLQSSAKAQFSVCLFSPSASEPAVRDASRADLPVPLASRVPTLGLVLFLLKNATADFFRFHQSHQQSLGKLQGLENLPPEELKELCQALAYGSGGVDKIPPVQRSVLAKRRLVQLINNRAKLLALSSYVIETCLFVLWRHLEYYLLYCTPSDPKDSLLPSSNSFGMLQSGGGAVWVCLMSAGRTWSSSRATWLAALGTPCRGSCWRWRWCTVRRARATPSYRCWSAGSAACSAGPRVNPPPRPPRLKPCAPRTGRGRT